jgi:hypothetical protein
MRCGLPASVGLALLLSACGTADVEKERRGGGALPPLLVPRTEELTSFEHPDRCAECHTEHAAQWQISSHAYAQVDPVFQAMNRLGQARTQEELGRFCVHCHSPTGSVGEQVQAQEETGGVYVAPFEAPDAIGRAGVSCDVCHSITHVVEPMNARIAMTPDGIKRATILDPVPTEAHGSAYSELHETSELCGGCHAVTNPRGALLEETFGEYLKSGAAKRGESCQSCHMPAYEGRAAQDAPVRTLHRHDFVGVDVSLLPEDAFPGYHELRERSAALLRASAALSAQAVPEERALSLRIENLTGHALPSGTTAERQLWIELTVKNQAGEVVFSSGTLDENGDVRDGVQGHSQRPGSDPQLKYFGQQLVAIDGFAKLSDAEKAQRRSQAERACVPMAQGAVKPSLGVKPVAFPWEADWQCNMLIQPDETAELRYDLTSLPTGTYQVKVRLLFRSLPPHFLRLLEQEAGLAPEIKTRVPIVEVAARALELALP